MKTVKWLAIGSAVCLFINFRAAGDIIYNNSTGNTGFRLDAANNQEVGDELNLSGPGYYLTNFSFNFYTSIASGDNVTLEVLFRNNDGAPFNGYATPGSIFYDSGAFSLNSVTNDGGLDFDISDLSTGDTVPLNSNVPMPTNFSFSVVVTGLEGSDVFALDLYNPVTVGSSAPDYWLNPGGGWELLTNSDTPVNFGAVFQGSLTPAPEPAVISISLLSGAAWL